MFKVVFLSSMVCSEKCNAWLIANFLFTIIRYFILKTINFKLNFPNIEDKI